MPKRGHNTDGGQRNETGSVMPIYWRLTESLLPSVPVAVFNKCTLHRESETKLLIMGSTMEIPSITIDIEDGLGTIVSAWMQDDPDVPALIVIVFEFKVLVASPITGEIVYNKENPEATCAVIVDECICFATATCVIVDHLALEVEPVVYNYENPLISILGDSLIICHSNYDGTFSLERIPVGSVEVIETKIYTGPTDLGMPIALNSSTINKDAFLIRILCSKGLLVLSSHNILKIKGNYCDEGIFEKADGSIVFILSNDDGVLEIVNESGATETYLYPCILGASSITVKALSNHTGFFCNGSRQLARLERSRRQ